MTKSAVWIIDDHQLFSAGLRQMLAARTQTHDIQCFPHPAEVPADPPLPVALIVLDFYIPGADTLAYLSRFSRDYPATPLVVISSSTSLADKKHCLDHGASAYYPKHAPPDVTLKSLARFLVGADGATDRRLELPPERHDLTAKQVEILIQVARGFSNKKIAELLFVSPETVKSHLAVIYRQVGCGNRDEAVQWARDKGLV